MSDAWDKASGMADKHANQGGIYVRLANDRDSIIGVFCGEPFAREVVWTGEQYEAYDEGNPDHASLQIGTNVSNHIRKVIDSLQTHIRLRGSCIQRQPDEVEAVGYLLNIGRQQGAVRNHVDTVRL